MQQKHEQRHDVWYTEHGQTRKVSGTCRRFSLVLCAATITEASANRQVTLSAEKRWVGMVPASL